MGYKILPVFVQTTSNVISYTAIHLDLEKIKFKAISIHNTNKNKHGKWDVHSIGEVISIFSVLLISYNMFDICLWHSPLLTHISNGICFQFSNAAITQVGNALTACTVADSKKSTTSLKNLCRKQYNCKRNANKRVIVGHCIEASCVMLKTKWA
jgi:hypothetical protein